MKLSSAASLLTVVLQSTSCSAFMQGAPTLRRGFDSSPLVKNKLNAVSAPPEKNSISASDGDDGIPDVEFPPPLSKVDRLKRAAKFWSTAVPIVLSYYSKSAEIQAAKAFKGTELTPEEEEIIWEEQHAKGAQKLADIITSLKGFYVKTAQIIASRRDLFPKEYTEALSDFTDNVDPLPTPLIKAVVVKELLNRGEVFEDVFQEFDEVPLGAASIAQVHRAVLTEKYGGKEVAVKIQRPSIESKLMGDIANLKALSKAFRDNDALPLDYYTVFSELEGQLQDEFDFVAESVAMDRVYDTVTKDENGMPCASPIVLPRPVPGLVSKRVLVMDYLEGVPLSRAAEEMLKKGIDPDSPEAQLFGRKLLRSLTDVFGRCILETGFFHADPHPGNIFVLKDGSIGLIDFGQVKQISGRARETLAKVMIALDDRESDTNPDDLDKIGNLALELGVELNEDAQQEAAAAVAMWLFDGSVDNLPGGYDKGELSPNSPVKELMSFPQDLVLVGRSSILIKGLSNRLNIPWSLSKEWAPTARRVIEGNKADVSMIKENDKVRFRDVVNVLKTWSGGKASRAVTKLPTPLRSKVAGLALRIQKRKEAKSSS
jgi:aarF domain-containing kinase